MLHLAVLFFGVFFFAVAVIGSSLVGLLVVEEDLIGLLLNTLAAVHDDAGERQRRQVEHRVRQLLVGGAGDALVLRLDHEAVAVASVAEEDVAAHGRVVLTGYGADAAFRVPVRYAGELLIRGKLLRLAGEVAQYVLVRHRLPRVRMGALVRRWLGRRSPPDEIPVWLNRDFAARGNFHARWQHVNAKPAPVHPTRPDAYHLLTSADWPFLFEGYDPGVTGVPVEARHPFFDLRLVDYLLAIPPMPWCFDKTILRLVMRGLLPDAVRLRPKTVAPGDPLVALLRRPGAHWVDRFEPVPALRAYVDPARIPPVCGEQDSNAIWMNLRPLGLNLWLQSELAS